MIESLTPGDSLSQLVQLRARNFGIRIKWTGKAIEDIDALCQEYWSRKNFNECLWDNGRKICNAAVVAFLIGGLAVLKWPCSCGAEQREYEKATSAESFDLFHGSGATSRFASAYRCRLRKSKGPGLLPGNLATFRGPRKEVLSRSGTTEVPNRKMANRSGDAQLGILPSEARRQLMAA
jgi:hypothetical protein